MTTMDRMNALTYGTGLRPGCARDASSLVAPTRCRAHATGLSFVGITSTPKAAGTWQLSSTRFLERAT
jgi:hypothetical protein